jgi:acetylglutamate kinase
MSEQLPAGFSARFGEKALVVRVDEPSVRGGSPTFAEDLQILADARVRPVIVAPQPSTAREIVRAINRSANVAVALSGSDAALLPHSAHGIGRVQTGILQTLLAAGYVPVIEPTAFAAFSPDDAGVVADDVAAAVACALDAVRAIFFHDAGGVSDPATRALIEELTPAEALQLAEDPRVAADLRAAVRAGALGVRGGVEAAQIVDGRVPHAVVIELLTARHVGTQIAGGLFVAA